MALNMSMLACFQVRLPHSCIRDSGNAWIEGKVSKVYRLEQTKNLQQSYMQQQAIPSEQDCIGGTALFRHHLFHSHSCEGEGAALRSPAAPAAVELMGSLLIRPLGEQPEASLSA